MIPGSPELSLKTQRGSAGHSPWKRNLSTESQQQLVSCTQGMTDVSTRDEPGENGAQHPQAHKHPLEGISLQDAPTAGKLRGERDNPRLAQNITSLDTPEHHLPAQEEGKPITYTRLKESVSLSHGMLSLDAQTAEEQSLHEISKHKLWANLLLTSRNPAANNFMRQKSASFFADNVPMLVTAMPKS